MNHDIRRMRLRLCTLLPILLLLPAFSACTASGFECGTPLASDPALTHTCDLPEEVCICATRSCAQPEHPASDAKHACESGLRYVTDKSFVTANELAGACVDPAHKLSAIDQPDGQSRCPGSPPVPNDSATDGTSTGTASDSESTGTTTGTSTDTN